MIEELFSLEGKANRFTCWRRFLIGGAILLGLFILQRVSGSIVIHYELLTFGRVHGLFYGCFSTAIFLIISWCLTATAIKRCNDLGVPGWYFLIPGWNIVMLPFAKGNSSE